MTTEVSLEKLYTIEEFSKLGSEYERYELIRGKLVKMAPTSRGHGKIASRLTMYLETHVFQNKLGETYVSDTGFVLDAVNNTVREADLGFIRAERLIGIPEDVFLPIVPDLVVEIISPSDSLTKVDEKVQEWLSAGVRLVWVINPRQRKAVYVYRANSKERQTLTLEDELDGEDVVSGFKLKVEALFE